MTQWEYWFATVPQKGFHNMNDAQAWFNVQGRDGWELVSISPSGDTAVFKRPLPASKPN